MLKSCLKSWCVYFFSLISLVKKHKSTILLNFFETFIAQCVMIHFKPYGYSCSSHLKLNALEQIVVTISDGLGHPITHSKGLNTIFVNFDSIPLVKLWQNLGEKLKNIYYLIWFQNPLHTQWVEFCKCQKDVRTM